MDRGRFHRRRAFDWTFLSVDRSPSFHVSATSGPAGPVPSCSGSSSGRRTSHRSGSLFMMTVLLAACGSSGTTGPASTPSAPASLPPTEVAGGEEARLLFEYDPQVPLAIEEVSMSEVDGAEVHDISYAGGSGDTRVSAYLVVPVGEGPFAGVVFMHWGGGSRSSFLEEAKKLATEGVVSLLVNAPFRQDAGYFAEVVVGLRRGTDLLSARSDVDVSRLGFVGHSWGAAFGAILADVDRRFRTYILMAGVPSLSEFWDSEDMVPFDGIDHIGRAAPASLFFQYADRDENVTAGMSIQFYDAGSEPKRIESYDTTHSFASEQASSDRSEWLAEELGLP